MIIGIDVTIDIILSIRGGIIIVIILMEKIPHRNKALSLLLFAIMIGFYLMISPWSPPFTNIQSCWSTPKVVRADEKFGGFLACSPTNPAIMMNCRVGRTKRGDSRFVRGTTWSGTCSTVRPRYVDMTSGRRHHLRKRRTKSTDVQPRCHSTTVPSTVDGWPSLTIWFYQRQQQQQQWWWNR